MPAVHNVAEPIPEAERNARVYAGEIVVFRGFEAVGRLVDTLQAHCRAHLGPDPERVHTRLTEIEANTAAETLRQAVMADEAVTEALNVALEAVGVDLARNFGDGLKQRVQLAQSSSGRRMVSPLGAHRDTWGSNIMAQTNWWAPTFPTAPERTIAVFPGHFERPVANDSAGWDFRELVRRMKAEGPEPDYPLLPLATEPPPWEDALAINLLPGDLMCFSGAQLHASVPNSTDRTRLSFEMRSANGADVAAGRGAPNVDGEPVRTTYQMFRRLTDRAKLGEMG